MYKLYLIIVDNGVYFKFYICLYLLTIQLDNDIKQS